MNKFNPTRPYETNVTYDDKMIYSVRFKGKFTTKAIKKYTQQKSNAMKARHKNGAIFAVVLRYSKVGYKSGGFTRTGETVRLWIDDYPDSEPGQIIGFEMQFTRI